MPRIAKDLGPFLLSTSDDSLSLVLETLSVIMETNKGIWITVDLAESLVLATLDVWSRNNKGLRCLKFVKYVGLKLTRLS
jgi:importin-9